MSNDKWRITQPENPDKAADEFFQNKEFFLQASFSKPPRGAKLQDDSVVSLLSFLPQKESKESFERAKIKPVNKNGEIGYFAEFFTAEKAFHRTYSLDEFVNIIHVLFPRLFRNCVLRFCRDSKILTLTAISNKRGNITILRSVTGASEAKADSPRGIQIPQGTPVPFLVHLGIMTPKGAIIASKQKKFRQINHFLTHIDDIFGAEKNAGKNSGAEEPAGGSKEIVRIVDFGSGKSYLTFAVHYLFTALYKQPVEIIGIDQKTDVVAHCNELSRLLSCMGLSFIEEKVENFLSADSPLKTPPHLLISLHACDTATDYALAYAVRTNVPAIICVPCCQHELNTQLRAQNTPDAFTPLVSHGLLKERFSALATDAIRVALLEQAGYTVHVLEFTGAEDTPKNLLIRAVKTKTAPGAAPVKTTIEQDALSRTLGVSLTLENLLQKTQ